jgi:hypothetical protein
MGFQQPYRCFIIEEIEGRIDNRVGDKDSVSLTPCGVAGLEQVPAARLLDSFPIDDGSIPVGSRRRRREVDQIA